MDIVRAMQDPKLFRPWFRDLDTWRAWIAFLKATHALPMTPEELEIFRQCTGRETPSAHPEREIWTIVGRRGGKTLIMALIAVHMALFQDWRKYLVPGERGTVLVLAADRRQAQSVMRYATALCTEVPMLASKVERVTSEEIEFGNRTQIEVGTASFRSVRGRTLICAIFDEIAFFRTEDSANPDREIIDAVLPAMASMPGSRMICASSPHAQMGVLWDAYRKHYGVAGAPLVWKAPTQTMNPTIPQSVIDAAYARDAAVASAEFGAEFRADIEGYVTEAIVSACTTPNRIELPHISGTKYHAFVDPSGGSSDSMTLAISHREGTKAVLDLVREKKPPFSPDAVVSEFAETIRSYGISRVTGDRYAGEFAREPFRKKGVQYDLSDQPASDIFRDFLPLLNSGQAELLDVPRIATQLCALERRTTKAGKETIDHPRGGHNDLANAVAGAMLLAARKKFNPVTDIDWAATGNSACDPSVHPESYTGPRRNRMFGGFGTW